MVRLIDWKKFTAGLTALAAGVALFVGAAAPAHAEEHAMLICIPGGPGSTAEAAERLPKLFARFGEVTGLQWRGEYHTVKASCDKYLEEQRPVLGLFDYATFLEQREARKLVPAVEVIRQGQGQNRYFLVAKKGQGLEALKGKGLWSAHLDAAAFISKVAFDGRIDIAKDFEGKRTASSLKAIKALAKGEADVILIDENEYASLGELPFAGDLEAIATSDPLPGVPLVVIGGDEALAKRLGDKLPALCQGAEEVCKSIELVAFRPLDANTYTQVLERWARR
jgi:hypothetical protein